MKLKRRRRKRRQNIPVNINCNGFDDGRTMPNNFFNLFTRAPNTSRSPSSTRKNWRHLERLCASSMRCWGDAAPLVVLRFTLTLRRRDDCSRVVSTPLVDCARCGAGTGNDPLDVSRNSTANWSSLITRGDINTSVCNDGALYSTIYVCLLVGVLIFNVNIPLICLNYRVRLSTLKKKRNSKWKKNPKKHLERNTSGINRMSSSQLIFSSNINSKNIFNY